MARPNNVAMDTLNYYGNGKNASNGYQNYTFFLDKNAIKQVVQNHIFGQFASVKHMPLHTGKEWRIKVEHYSYERMPWAFKGDGPIDAKTLQLSEDFKKKGYVSNRSLSDVTENLFGDTTTFGRAWEDNTTNNASTQVGGTSGITSEGYLIDGTTEADSKSKTGKRLFEGQGASNKITIVDSTLNTFISQFGEMIDYTEDVELFSDLGFQKRAYEELGNRARDIIEDLHQITLLGTTNIMFSGAATSLATMGQGIAAGTPDAVTGLNAVEESYKANYRLIQSVAKRLQKYRVPSLKKMMTGVLQVGTTPIPECYVAICGPDVKFDLMEATRSSGKNDEFAFVGVEKYAKGTETFNGEFGKVGNIRFICYDKMMVEQGVGAAVDGGYVGNLSQTNNKFDVFPILIIGGDSFATIQLQGKGVFEFESMNPKQALSLDNPYANKGFISYKFWYGSVILRPERVLRLNVLASA